MKQAIGYIRVSTEQQASEGISLDAQRHKITAWCEVNGYELLAIEVDAGISGKSMKKRQGLQKALNAMKKDMALVVYSLTRLARSTKDTLTISETLRRSRSDLVSVTEKIDTTTAAGKMFFTMLAVMAEFESNTISERTRDAMRHKKATSEVYSPIPFGFKAVEGRLERVEAEAVIVSEVKQRRAAGETLQAIADSLNSRGIKGKRGGIWYPYSIKYLIERKEVGRAA